MKYVCGVCGYVYDEEKEGAKWEALPADYKCPVCKAPKEKFSAQAGELVWAAEHVVGIAKGAPEDIIADLRSNFEGECSEVGM
ncbi:MAG: rubredoxin, partial [Lachnospiraceae bacterium]|nr:rubredoxin [Lachnospiraceae bacterium]